MFAWCFKIRLTFSVCAILQENDKSKLFMLRISKVNHASWASRGRIEAPAGAMYCGIPASQAIKSQALKMLPSGSVESKRLKLFDRTFAQH